MILTIVNREKTYQVSVYDVCRVNVLEAPHQLVHKELDMVVIKLLFRFDYVAEIGFHQVRDAVAWLILVKCNAMQLFLEPVYTLKELPKAADLSAGRQSQTHAMLE